MVPTKILAIKLRALGDTILLTASLLELHRLFPQSKIHVLVPSEWASLIEHLPGIDRIWTYGRHPNTLNRTWSRALLLNSLRKENFDCVFNFHASPSSALLAWATGAKNRAIHFHGHQAKNRFSTFTLPGKGILKPAIERDLDTVRSLGVSIPAGSSPKVKLMPAEIANANALLIERGLTAPPLLGINLGASRPTKAWPVERFAQLAVKWCIRTEGSVVALAGPNETQLILSFLDFVERHLSKTIRDSKARLKIHNRIVTMNHLSLRALAGVLSQLSVVVGNDSGPKHLAIAVDTPTVTLFGPEHPYEWHPYSTERHPFLFIDKLLCRRDGDPGYPAWCGIQECHIEQHKCMRMIGVEEVLHECLRVKKP